MARNQTQFYDPEQDEDALVRVELGGETYEMPRSVAAEATREFHGATTPMSASEFYDDAPPPAAARPKPRPAARPIDMDLTNDPEAIAGGRGDWVDALAGTDSDVARDEAGMREAFDGDADADDWVGTLADGPAPAAPAPPSMSPIDDAVGRDMMHRSLGAPDVPTGPAPSAGFPQAWASALNRTPMPTPSPSMSPIDDAVGRDVMHRTLGNASIPSRPATISDPIAGGFPDAWANAVNRTPAPASAQSLAEDPEALDALAGPSPQPPPGTAPQYDMIVDPSQIELENLRKRLAGFRMGAAAP